MAVERAPPQFGDDRSVHLARQRWIAKGVFPLIRSLLVADCVELGGVDFDWQAADGAMGKARGGGTWWAKTPRIAVRA
ncbi:MAG: hypothetical protein ACK4WH_00330 [Phycisphaerales bacterium]